MISQAIRTRFPEGYWPRGMDGAAQYQSLAAFSKEIFPIWKGIEEKDKADESAMTSAEVSRAGQLMMEVKTLHKQDLAIYLSGIKPSRTDDNRDRMDRLRQKAVRASGSDLAAGDY